MSLSKRDMAFYRGNIERGEYLGASTVDKDGFPIWASEGLSHASDAQLLNLMSTSLLKARKKTLVKMQKALVNEPFICVGNWFDTQDGATKGSGCLFGAAYFQTKAFKEELKNCATSEDPVVCAISSAESNDYAVADALGIDPMLMGNIIELFDTWGSREGHSEIIESSYPDASNPDKLVTYTERVLSKRGRKTLLGRIDKAITAKTKS